MKSIIWVMQAGGLIMHMPQVSMAIIKPLIHPDLFYICPNLFISILILKMKINVNLSSSLNWLTMTYKGAVFDTLKIGKNRPRCVYNVWTYKTSVLVPSRMRKEYLCVSLGLHHAKSFMPLCAGQEESSYFFQLAIYWTNCAVIFLTLYSKSSVLLM